MSILLELNERRKLQPEFVSFTRVDYWGSVLRCRARHSHRLPLTRLGHRPHSVAPETNRCLFKAPKIAHEAFLACIGVCHARYKWGLFCFCGCRLIAWHFTYLHLARLPTSSHRSPWGCNRMEKGHFRRRPSRARVRRGDEAGMFVQDLMCRS